MSHTIKYLLVGSVLGVALAAGGCVVRSGVGVHSGGYVEEPTLAYVQPGVWVIADYSEPVFYSDNYYWAYRGGGWYRSDIYSGGWVRVYSVPHRVRGIRNPHNYAHYRVPPRAQTRRAPAPRVRDHRAQPAGRAYPPARSNTRVPAQRGGQPAYQAPPPRGRPAARPAPRGGAAKATKKKAPPPPPKKKSDSRDHR